MSEILTLETAKINLAEPGTARDTLIQGTINRAEKILLDYIGGYADLTEFYYDRGEQDTSVIEAALIVMVITMIDTPTEDPLSKTVRAIVRRLRNPVIT